MGAHHFAKSEFVSALFRFQPCQYRLLHGPEDVFAAGAAAEVTGHADADLLVGQRPALVMDLHCAHDGAWRAEAALDAVSSKGLLDVGQLAVRPFQVLQRQYVLAVGPDRQVDAGIEAFPVDDDVTSPALAHLS